jgi:hypothetical protein
MQSTWHFFGDILRKANVSDAQNFKQIQMSHTHSHNHLLLPSHDSFLNGFELQLDDEIDALAMESFWAFLSGASSLLSAFEWILMMQHISEVLDHAEPAVASPKARTGGEVEAGADCATETRVKWEFEGGGEFCSSVLKFRDSDERTAAEEAGRGGLRGADIDTRIAYDAHAVCHDIEAVSAFVSIGSELPAVEGIGCDSELLQLTSSFECDDLRAAHTAAAYNCDGVRDGITLNVVQHESPDTFSETEHKDLSECRGVRESSEGAASANVSKDDFIADCEEAQTEAALGHVFDGSSLPINDLVGTEVFTNDGDNGQAGSSAVSAAAPAAHACTLKTGAVTLSESHSGSFSSFAFGDAPSRLDAAALCALGQVTSCCILSLILFKRMKLSRMWLLCRCGCATQGLKLTG